MSGDLDVTVDETGKGLVRYRGNDSWYTIGNLEAEPPRSWATVADLAAAVEAGIGTRDAAGNIVPFEATPAGAENGPPAEDRGNQSPGTGQSADSHIDQPTDNQSGQPTDTRTGSADNQSNPPADSHSDQ
ncbi:hypothetical protein [Nocardia sp. NBC_01009]|uniref:hypothetical protein n=1 Tax=Nocardia sp. NBC_01009 TaxID=2975996 RepID=UPI00386C19AB|nr:hypothetical protein OHA42_11635 [Nocardia sp. NBC_01009]